MADDLEQIVGAIDKEVSDLLPAQPPSLQHGLRGKIKEWYARRGPRFKYNAEMVFGALAEMPGGLLGSAIGGYVGVQLTRLDRYIPLSVDTFVGEIDVPRLAITICTLVGSGAAYWGSWWALRRSSQRRVYEKYPEIKRQDIRRFVSASVLLGVGMTFARGWLTYLFNEWEFGELPSAAMALLPTQAAGISIMNVYGTYAGLVRNEAKLKEAIIDVKEKRGELAQPQGPGNITPG